MNWTDINTTPTNASDVIVKFDFGDDAWQKGYYENGVWYNSKSEPFTKFQLKHMTHWAEVKLPS
jgi:hypothetical protein